MVKDNAPPHKFGPGYDIIPDRTDGLSGKKFENMSMSEIARSITTGGAAKNTHSLGIKPHPHNNSIARQLLKRPKYQEVKPDDVINLKGGEKFVVLPKEDKRPLIDRVHEGTFTNPVGMQWFNDLYALRMMLRKAHCFTLDDTTSTMVADFSVAIGHDLESARRLAIPPYPVTWIDLNNVARLNRMKELGTALTPRAAGELEGAPVERAGWLVYECADHGGFYMQYFCVVDQGVLAAPLAYWWQCGSPNPRPTPQDATTEYLQGLTFGVHDVNVSAYDAYPTPTSWSHPLADIARDQVRDMMQELAGELRHLWGLLLALNATSRFGVEMKQETQPKHTDIRTMSNNKPLLPLEHKVLHLHLRKRWPAAKVVQGVVANSRHRWHEVRGHLRTLASGRIIPVRAHERGDEKLGKIIKTYKVEK